ncbi:MAG: hypothetical protein RIR62_1450 [Pseudomonadota bacterium]|jgi:predicted Zn finger-like uncharacterized protein
MRLICPNCDAIYEVDDSAIPDGGRDVQCSNCGHAWFQLPEWAEAETADEAALFGAQDPEPAPAAAAEPDPTPEIMPEMQRRTLDEDVLAVLREEAEREAAARRAEAPAMETQVEMEMTPPPAPPAGGLVAGAARRIAQMKGLDPDARPVPPPRPGSRRDLLPDIEEINSSLKPAETDDADPDGPEPVAARSGGFRSGFTFMLLVAAAVVLGYVMAPRLAEQIPAAAPALDSYVAGVDAVRLWLDGMLRAATDAVRGLSGQDPPAG